MDFSVSFGSWLKKQRKTHDWTQTQLAKRVSCSAALIRKYEADERRPSKQIVTILADIFDVPIDQREAFFAYARSIEFHIPFQSNNLPLDLTLFIGRKSELELLAMRLTSPECRLLVLTGPGGIGKTRLAIQASRNLLSEFPDGVFLINVVGIDSSEYLASSIASALSLSFHGLADFKTQLLHHLHPQKLMLLIDNYEHLLPRTDLIVEILKTAPNVKIMVTSRERLNIQAEWGFPVGGLPYPDRMTDDYAHFETIQLFEQRALQVDTRFVMTEADRLFVGRICALAQGNPLAIELAASWTRILTCQEIADAIQRNENFPSTDSRNVPERHQNMNAVFEHSWKRLSTEERMGFMKLSLFRGGFTQEAARGVSNVSLSMLANLQDKSFIMHSTQGHYEIHELLRRYGESRLNELPNELNETRRGLIAYYANLFHELGSDVWDARHKTAIVRIKQEIDNIRYTWNLASQSGGWEFFVEAIIPIWHYYLDTNLFEEGAALFQQTAARLLSLPQNPTHALVLASFFQGAAAWSALYLGKLAEAKIFIDTSLMWLDKSGLYDTREEMISKGSAFFVAQASKDDKAMRRYANECLQVGQRSGDEISLIGGHYFCGIVSRTVGDMSKAKTHFYEALRYSESAKSQWIHAYLLSELGQVELADQNVSAAKTLFKKSADLFFDHNDLCNGSAALILLGIAHLKTRDETQAAACYYDALRKSSAIHALPVVVDALIEIASLLVDRTESATVFEIFKAVQFHPAIRPDARTRVGFIVSNLRDSPSVGALDTESTDNLQSAVGAALKVEHLFRNAS